MTEIRIRVNEDVLHEMDRLVNGKELQGRRWLKDAVAIYKEILAERIRQNEVAIRNRARCRRPVRRQALREVLRAGRDATVRLFHAHAVRDAASPAR